MESNNIENTREKSMQNDNAYNGAEQDEIDLIAMAVRMWDKRRFILKIFAVFICIGLFVAIFSPKEYTASSVVVPQTGEKGVSGSLSSLASLAGINLGGMASSGGVLSTKVYTNVANNVNFKKELMSTKIYFEKFGKEISLLDYYTDKEYNRVSVLGAIKKYTIGLPGVIISAFRKDDSADTSSVVSGVERAMISMTKEESDCAKILALITNLTVNDKDGYVTISASMPEAYAAAKLAETYTGLLEKYVTEFKLEKAQAGYDFIKQRYDEAKVEYEQKQIEYAAFKDANRSLTSAVASIKYEQVKNDYELAYSLFSELSKQLIQAEITVKEDTPIFTVIEPAVVPREKSKPRRSLILIAFAFLGGIAGCGAVLGLDYLKANLNSDYINSRWV